MVLLALVYAFGVSLSWAIGVSSHVCKGKGAIAFWAGPNLVVWAHYAFWARGHIATNCRSKKKFKKASQTRLVGCYTGDDELLKSWMLLEEADLEHGFKHAVSSSYRANLGE
ncbi:hypothetical protein Tco_1045980 [Tanacetum coccineum]